ncbi:GNAT family N-acetyltransferase [Deinococcus sp.]|uniref:GNAT family N-acetyltransferase n=1 Tax=Deinococcus sp. TaxID=47478 RepID=UPI003C7DFB34
MTDTETLPLLDNPFWHALRGPQRALGQVGKLAARYRPQVSAMAGLESDTPAAWTELDTLTAPGEIAALFGPVLLDAPGGWTRVAQFATVQMVQTGQAAALPSPDGLLGKALTLQDVPAMLDLVGLTRPGPFQPGTIEMGLYLGLWDESGPTGPRLAAMTGQRARLPGACEISAVCTHPEYRRRGLARALVSQVAALTRESGLTPFLHVAPDNAAAQATYRQLGFVPRREIWVSVMRRGEDARPGLAALTP